MGIERWRPVAFRLSHLHGGQELRANVTLTGLLLLPDARNGMILCVPTPLRRPDLLRGTAAPGTVQFRQQCQSSLYITTRGARPKARLRIELGQRGDRQLLDTDSQIEPELNVWRQLNFSNGPCFGLLKSVHHRLCSTLGFADASSRVYWVSIVSESSGPRLRRPLKSWCLRVK